ncbi:uncharacterized protein DFL_009004 [Arthrobotrys flagrans]|uniref:Uncharacterized protein n=1 Tax=Arthrobotrys flagrans TaxID=97331 RepID=A0A436ZQD2_ARTFL|nr:hypothetical protein DFL_009004 [Arthrobotrys flagrans]
MKSLRAALATELTHALPKCWATKAEAMLKCRSLSRASLTLQLAFQTSPPEECNKIQYGVLLENLRRFVEGSWDPVYPFEGQDPADISPDFASPSQRNSGGILSLWGTNTMKPPYAPGKDKTGIQMATFFRALGSIERPTKLLTEPLDYRFWESLLRRTHKSEREGAIFPLRIASRIPDHQMSLYYFDPRGLSQPLFEQYETFISKRSAAAKGRRYPAIMEEIDKLLLSFYPGAEDLKRWLATKAYLLAMVNEWRRSTKVAHMLEYAPLDINDDYNFVIYLTQALTYLRNGGYSEAEMSCYKALQYREIPECDRDEVYCILSMVARKTGASREADEHLR